MAIIRLYKYVLSDDGNTEIVYRYTVPNLESLNVQYNTPISPMPLPEEDADENILVKIDGGDRLEEHTQIRSSFNFYRMGLKTPAPEIIILLNF